MSSERHETVLGEIIEHPTPSGEIAAWLERVKRAAYDPSVSEAQLTKLVYSPENPILDPTVLPARGAVTRAVAASPLYRVMLDLLDVKRAQTGALDLRAANARFSIGVGQAAQRLATSEDAVRRAIAARHLAAVCRDGVHLIDPATVETYRERLVGRRSVQRAG